MLSDFERYIRKIAKKVNGKMVLINLYSFVVDMATAIPYYFVNNTHQKRNGFVYYTGDEYEVDSQNIKYVLCS